MRAQLSVVIIAVAAAGCVGSDPKACTDCGGTCVDTRSDSKNCGGCGVSCSAGEVCSASKCVASCTTGQRICSSGCADVQTDPRNCGACGTACNPGEVCSAGMCEVSCGTGYSTCPGLGGAMTCVDLEGDSKNCGMCGRACATGEACVAMQCTVLCPGTRTACGNPAYCTDTQTDLLNCGVCSHNCQLGTACNGGVCDVACDAPLVSCNADAGAAPHYCANLTNDPKNCGACGVTCLPGSVCTTGGCQPIALHNCDEVRSLFNTNVDGEWILHANGNIYTPFRAWCADMNGGATDVLFDGGVVDSGYPGVKTYLTLKQTGARQNYSEHNNEGFAMLLADGGSPQPDGGGVYYPPALTNKWTRLRMDTTGQSVDNLDYRFATTAGRAQNVPNRGLEYAMAAGCTGGDNGTANVDLRGTPFLISTANTWSTGQPGESSGGTGSATPGNDRKTMAITGGGSCGVWSLTRNTGFIDHRMALTPSGLGCKEILTMRPGTPSGVYSLLDGAGGPDAGVLQPPLAYCDMTSSGGGWTLALKVDGTNPSSRFFYDDPLWTNVATYNAGMPDLSRAEAKYPAFMATPFDRIRLVYGEADGGFPRALNLQGNAWDSMLTAMRAPQTGMTAVGQAGWGTFFGNGGVQPFCQQEGTNTYPAPGWVRVRIGLIGNDQMNCVSPDSYSGVGGLAVSCTNLKPAGFRGYSAGVWGANTPGCQPSGNGDLGAFVYVYVK